MNEEYFLLAVLDDASQRRLNEISDELTCQGFQYTKDTPYHITLWNGEKPNEKLISHFERICGKTAPIDTALCSIGLFGLTVLFLSPLPCTPLTKLEEDICGYVNNNLVGWVPHCTMRMGSEDNIASAVPVLAKCFAPFPVRIERLELYGCGENYARFERSFPLLGNESDLTICRSRPAI
ncbi:MAG: hypothetical protein LBD85_02880 [Oscillospiraceae bacterium]|jgi:hypothetical protein|nr:hypothetical protein [Oscillospiraceae bacterium]